MRQQYVQAGSPLFSNHFLKKWSTDYHMFTSINFNSTKQPSETAFAFHWFSPVLMHRPRVASIRRQIEVRAFTLFRRNFFGGVPSAFFSAIGVFKANLRISDCGSSSIRAIGYERLRLTRESNPSIWWPSVSTYTSSSDYLILNLSYLDPRIELCRLLGIP